jgi:hypothetical protein
VKTRIFEGVQQPVCIVLAARSARCDANVPARVRFRALPAGHRTDKFTALADLRLDGNDWIDGPTDWRAPFLPASTGAWATFPKLEELFDYNGSGVMPGRTWIIAPDAESLERRWKRLIAAPKEQMDELFQPHLAGDQLGDRHSSRIVKQGLPGHEARPKAISEESGPPISPIRYGCRSFDRQWILPDNRLINRPNPELWSRHSDHQLYLTSLSRTSPSGGPALSFTSLVPDLDHYNGRGGRVFPLWRDAAGSVPNLPPGLLPYLEERLGRKVSAPDWLAYLAAVAAHPAFTARFLDDLSTPGLRIPVTAEAATFEEATALGRTVLWLHTFGERFADPSEGRPAQPPRLPEAKRPRIPAAGAIPLTPDAMPNTIDYDAAKGRLLVGTGYVENVPPAVWHYEVSGKQVLLQWFSYRKRDRERPIIGDRRTPSPLGRIQPDHWLAEYTSELINVLNVLGRLVELEPRQAELLGKICAGPLVSGEDLRTAGALDVPAADKKKAQAPTLPGLFD